MFNPSNLIIPAYISATSAFIYVTFIFATLPDSGCSVTSKPNVPLSQSYNKLIHFSPSSPFSAENEAEIGAVCIYARPSLKILVCTGKLFIVTVPFPFPAFMFIIKSDFFRLCVILCVTFFSLPYNSVLSAFSKNLDLFSSLSACRSIFSYSIRPLNSSSAS